MLYYIYIYCSGKFFATEFPILSEFPSDRHFANISHINNNYLLKNQKKKLTKMKLSLLSNNSYVDCNREKSENVCEIKFILL